MQDDLENMTGQDQPQPEESQAAGLDTHPPATEEASPPTESVQGPETDDSSLDDIRQLLVKEDAEEAASREKKGKKPTLVRIMTGILGRGHKPPEPPAEAGLPALDDQGTRPEDPELEAKLSALLIDQPVAAAETTDQPAGPDVETSPLPAELLPTSIAPVERADSNESLDIERPVASTAAETPESETPTGPPAILPEGEPPRALAQLAPGETVLPAGEASPTPPDLAVPPGEASVEEAGLLEGLEQAEQTAGEPAGSPALADAPAPVPGAEVSSTGEPSLQSAPPAEPARPLSPIRRLVTSILLPRSKRMPTTPVEEMGDTEIIDRLGNQKAPATGEPMAPSGPHPEPGTVAAGPSEMVPFGMAPPGSVGASEEDENLSAIWGAYVDQANQPKASDGPMNGATPINGINAVQEDSQPPFVKEPVDYTFDQEGSEATTDQSRPPFIPTDPAGSDWLGDLRTSMQDEKQNEVGSSAEIETPTEKSEIWDHLVGESAGEGEKEIGAEVDAAGNTSGAAPTAEEETGENPDFEPPQTDDYSAWYSGNEEPNQEKADSFGLPEPSEEAMESLLETTKLYESIFEDQKQQELRAALLEESITPEGAPATSFEDVMEEPEAPPKSWWQRMSSFQRAMVVLVTVVVMVLAVLTGLYLMPRPAPTVATAPPPTAIAENNSVAPSSPYPIGIQLTGGWIFSLNRSTMVGGRWQPKGGEWLNGTQVRRVVAIPWSRQVEAVVKSFQPGDQIRLIFSNKQIIDYQVSQVKQVPVSDTSLLIDTKPSVAIILYQPDAPERWVVIANQ